LSRIKNQELRSLVVVANEYEAIYYIEVNNKQKIKELKQKLAKYEEQLAWEMKTYRGVIHESAASEIKHNKVMVLRAMVDDLKKEIKLLEDANPKSS